MAFNPNVPATSDIFVTVQSEFGSLVVQGRGPEAGLDGKVEQYHVKGAGVAPLSVQYKDASPEGKFAMVVPAEGPALVRAITGGSRKRRFYEIDCTIRFVAKKPGLQTITWECQGAKFSQIPGASMVDIGADKVGGDAMFKFCKLAYLIGNRRTFVIGKEAA